MAIPTDPNNSDYSIHPDEITAGCTPDNSMPMDTSTVTPPEDHTYSHPPVMFTESNTRLSDDAETSNSTEVRA